MYNSSLALFYLLMIKQRWSDERLYRIERWVHGFILSFTVGTSILLLQLEQYNHIGAVSVSDIRRLQLYVLLRVVRHSLNLQYFLCYF